MAKSTLNIHIYDGTRRLFSKPLDVLITIVDGNQRQQFREVKQGSTHSFAVPFFDNMFDKYSVVVSAKGYRQVGFTPVKLSADAPVTLDLMLIADDPGYSFVDARWPTAFAKYPFLGGDTDAVSAQTRYEKLLESEEPLAAMLNLTEAMSDLHLARGTPLDYIRQVRWDRPPAADRFFAWCDEALVAEVRDAARAGLFSPEPGSALLHPGATASWKQIQFGEANVQLTFHENDRKAIGGVNCVTVEADMDYYKDPLAHALLEVLPNRLTGSLSDPLEVYTLPWMAGRHANVPEFDPIYTVA